MLNGLVCINEQNNTLAYLDFKLTRFQDLIITDVYRKPTQTNQYINFKSNHSNIIKEGTIKCLINRARSHCSTPENYQNEIKIITNAFLLNGYSIKYINKILKWKKPLNKPDPPITTISIEYINNFSDKIKRILSNYNIRTVFKSSFTIKKSLIHTRPFNIIQNSKNWVYGIECNCGEIYIGESKRPLNIRLNEHKNNIRNKFKDPFNENLTNSLLANHIYENCDHIINWESTRKICKEEFWKKRKFIEAATMKCLQKQCYKIISQESCEFDEIWNKTLIKEITNKWIVSAPDRNLVIN
jgi:predicted GIY-YIG superfamily endonuclease